MSKAKLPNARLFNKAFIERGRDDVVKVDVLPIEDGASLRLTFESKLSPWRQGVWLMTDQYLVVNGQHCSSVELWEDTSPRDVTMECHTQNGWLHLYNIWDRGKGCESQLLSTGMLVEEIENGRRYRCSDIGFDADFSRLVFSIQSIP